MALPPIPDGYDSWNDYIETEAPALAVAQGITLQEAKASLKLLYVSRPIRSAEGQPYYRQYNVFTTWDERALLPDAGRPWRLEAPGGLVLTTSDGKTLITQDGRAIIT